MIIQCTSCNKKFNVPDGAIVDAGRLVQCSSCGNQWTQYPVKIKTPEKKPIAAQVKKTTKKTVTKKKTPIPYSKEYMKQKWGTSLQNYAIGKGLSKNPKTIAKAKIPKKTQKQISTKVIKKPGFGFFNYIITYSILFIFLDGILNFEKSRLGRKFPFLEPYIENFFETLEILKTFILDFFR